MTMFDSGACVSELHASTLIGTSLTHFARGEAQVPLKTAVKTARTCLRKRHVSASALRAILDEVKAVGFRDSESGRTMTNGGAVFKR